jgi:hypothetical protein
MDEDQFVTQQAIRLLEAYGLDAEKRTISEAVRMVRRTLKEAKKQRSADAPLDGGE